MEQALRCNNQVGGYCRAPLTEQAVVTTCSHVFCLSCADKTGFLQVSSHRRACPVCSTPLPNNDDVVQTRLSPSEDYKTSVLSGLDPTTVMECASRAFAFWTYQTTQEIYYQEHLCKNLTHKYSHLSSEMDKIINEANSEMQKLQNQISGLSIDQKTLQQKYNEVSDAYREKTKKHGQLQQMYDALKKRYLARDAETAASATVNQTLQTLGAGTKLSTDHDRPELDPLQVYNEGIAQQKARSDHSCTSARQGHQLSDINDRHEGPSNMPPPPRPSLSTRALPGASSNTPVHRTALPTTTRLTANRSHIPMSTSRQDSRPLLQNHAVLPTSSSRRQFTAEGTINRNISSIPRGYGALVNGMKIGRAGTSGDLGVDHQLGQYDGHTKQPHGGAPLPRNTNSHDESRGYY